MPKLNYKVGVFFGVSYNYKLADKVEEVLSGSKYKQLFEGDDAQFITEDGRLIETSTSDDDGASRVMIVCSNMTSYGPKKKDADDAYINLNPSWLLDAEKQYPKTVEELKLVHQTLRESKKFKDSDLHFGWTFSVCYLED